MPAFRIGVTSLDATRVRLTLAGEIDLANADQVVERGCACLEQAATQALVIDLEQVTFMDSTALSALVQLHNAAVEAAKTVTLVKVPPRIERLLDLTGLASVLAIE